MQFFFRDAAKCLVFTIHADILGLVEPTEHTDLREFGNACEEDKAHVFSNVIVIVRRAVSCREKMTGYLYFYYFCG